MLRNFDKKTILLAVLILLVIICSVSLGLIIGNTATQDQVENSPTQKILMEVTPTITIVLTSSSTPTITPTPTITLTPTITPTLTPTMKPVEKTATVVQKTKSYLDQYKQIDYRELVNYADDHAGEMIKVSGTVFNIIDNQDFQFYFSGTYDAGIVLTRNSFTGLYEDDKVTIYGIVYGNWCGTNAFGAEICQPALIDAFFEK